MSMSRYDPFREALSLRNVMDQLFAQSFVRPRWLPEASEAAFTPIDVAETEQGYQVRVAVPGVKPEDIELTLNQNTLTIKGEYRSDYTNEQEPGQQAASADATNTPQASQQTRERTNWLIREMQAGAFQRSVSFERPVDPEHVETKYADGILTVMLPVSAASKPRRITVNGGGSGQGQTTPPETTH